MRRVQFAPILTSLLLGFACASRSSTFASQWKKLNQTLLSRIEACQTQNHTIVQAAITTLDVSAANSDEYVAFVQDEAAAINFINQFDLTKLTAAEEFEYLQILMDNCNTETLKQYEQLARDRKYCVEVFDDFNFMRGLIFAIKNYQWSTQTKKLANEKLFAYLKLIATWPTSPAIYSFIASSLLESMVNSHLVGTQWKDQIVQLNQMADERAQFLQQSLEQLKKTEKDLCLSLRKKQQNEMIIAQQHSKELQELLQKIFSTP